MQITTQTGIMDRLVKYCKMSNTKGDTLYPKLIEKDIFTKAQQVYTMRNQTVLRGKIRCGECCEMYRKFIEHAGKPSEKSKWKCKNYISQNRVCCKNQIYTEDEIKDIFISVTNELVKNKWLLEKIPKKELPKISLELRQTENRIKELEQEEQYSSPEQTPAGKNMLIDAGNNEDSNFITSYIKQKK